MMLHVEVRIPEPRVLDQSPGDVDVFWKPSHCQALLFRRTFIPVPTGTVTGMRYCLSVYQIDFLCFTLEVVTS